MRFDIFGREVEVISRAGQWQVYYIGSEGKKRTCDDIVLPADLAAAEIPTYLADLCHEWATAEHGVVKLMGEPNTDEA